MSHLPIAGLQLELGADDNLETIEREIAQVAKRFPWVRMVILPELCTRGASTDHAAEPGSEAETRFRAAAREHGLWLVPGSLFERRGNAVFNTAPVIDPTGEVVARYDKRHPFLPYEKGVRRGQDFCVFDVPGAGRIGLMICFDMWFPEMVRQLVWMGAEAIIVPTLTNTIDRKLELAIAQANAACNQVYMVNINVAGDLGYGRSIVVGPDGNVIHQASTTREIIALELDFEHVRRSRERGIFSTVQTLKNFRDADVRYPVYQPGAGPGALAELGPLALPDETDNNGPHGAHT
ncbi:carbon-nitrogen hydrolase family protein [Marinihelvus fidelis]|uniref:Carbon-nitrogen hydrolase family protein n=1 Tax=Marinihelvus fidelis TaxID=2613842 RepID=A0A5N0TGH0_9GAMM|nr:carbon-nitrogen hydrolase family protein [Marinihelvus fidelis]KAA9133227.1 carbon-nitrogen hydrolase family protein [Marinihelvus fidelis]